MKKTIAIISLGPLLFVGQAFAAPRTITVDNKPGAVAMFTSLQAAYNDAAAGDTIQLASSPISYGGLDIYKRIHLTGPGYFLRENQVPGVLDAHVHVSLTLNVDPARGSASGTTLSGLYAVVVAPSAASAVVEQCILSGHGFSAPWTISRSVIAGPTGLATGSSVRNCLIADNITLSGVGITMSHCVFEGVLVSTQVSSSVSNSVFIENPHAFNTTTFRDRYKGSVTHSMAVANSILPEHKANFLPAGGGNQNNLNRADVFLEGTSQDSRWFLRPGSPAIGAGSGGADIGLFGGTTPYVLSGVRMQPRITRMVIPAAATDATGLRFEVDAKAF